MYLFLIVEILQFYGFYIRSNNPVVYMLILFNLYGSLIGIKL